MTKTPSNRNARRVLLFLGLTFGLTWLYCLTVLYPLISESGLGGVPTVSAQLLTAAVMFFPALSVLLIRLLTGEGMADSMVRPNLRGNLKVYLLVWFAPGVLTVLGSALYFLVFPHHFDPEFGYLTGLLSTAGAGLADLPVPLPVLLAIQLVQALFLGPILNFLPCFGEEWGWRGYLLPKLSQHLSPLPLVLVSGVIWGLWHAPLTVVGHNYGLDYPGFPFAGIAVMCLFCTVLGTIFSWATLKTGSCIPAVVGHGAVNAIAAGGLLFTGAEGTYPLLGPAPSGILALLPFLIVAILLFRRWPEKE